MHVSPCAAGQLLFEEFLRTEYSEENLLFWLACQDYKKIFSGTEMAATAQQIYAEFVQVDAPRQVRLSLLPHQIYFFKFKHFDLIKNNL